MTSTTLHSWMASRHGQRSQARPRACGEHARVRDLAHDVLERVDRTFHGDVHQAAFKALRLL